MIVIRARKFTLALTETFDDAPVALIVWRPHVVISVDVAVSDPMESVVKLWPDPPSMENVTVSEGENPISVTGMDPGAADFPTVNTDFTANPVVTEPDVGPVAVMTPLGYGSGGELSVRVNEPFASAVTALGAPAGNDAVTDSLARKPSPVTVVLCPDETVTGLIDTLGRTWNVVLAVEPVVSPTAHTVWVPPTSGFGIITVWPVPHPPVPPAVTFLRSVPVMESRLMSTSSRAPNPSPVVAAAVPGTPLAMVIAGWATVATWDETHGPTTPSASTYWTCAWIWSPGLYWGDSTVELAPGMTWPFFSQRMVRTRL